jgi:hypothetical protein
MVEGGELHNTSRIMVTVSAVRRSHLVDVGLSFKRWKRAVLRTRGILKIRKRAASSGEGMRVS